MNERINKNKMCYYYYFLKMFVYLNHKQTTAWQTLVTLLSKSTFFLKIQNACHTVHRTPPLCGVTVVDRSYHSKVHLLGPPKTDPNWIET